MGKKEGGRYIIAIKTTYVVKNMYSCATIALLRDGDLVCSRVALVWAYGGFLVLYVSKIPPGRGVTMGVYPYKCRGF